MRVVIVYQPGLVNDAIVAAVRAHPRVREALTVVERQGPLTTLRRVFARRHQPLFTTIDRLGFLAVYGVALRSQVDRTVTAALGRVACPPPDAAVDAANDALPRLIELAPDLVLVLGTTWLDGRWATLRCPVLNLHTGRVPRDRGRFCWFWPALEGRWSDLAISIHHVAPTMDAGPAVSVHTYAVPEAERGDLGALLAAAAIASRTACLALLDRWPPDPTPAAATELCGPMRFEPGLSDLLRFWRERQQ